MIASATLGTPSTGTTRRQALMGVVGAVGSLALTSAPAAAGTDDGISHTADAIHQEPEFAASPQRLYAALTDPKKFTRIVELSGALQAMHLPDQPAEIGAEPGGAFALFGGYITGRQLELMPNVRIVQAWRSASWPAGSYSIARFELIEQASGTKIVFDHAGFPKGTAESLAAGWKSHYWEPLAKLLAQEAGSAS
jgi:activator of HSP90 ATPase